MMHDPESGEAEVGIPADRSLGRGEVQRAGAAAAAVEPVDHDLEAPASGAQSKPLHGRKKQSFDHDWRFARGDRAGAQAVSYDHSRWRVLDAPHDWRIEDLPGENSDHGGATADPSLLIYNRASAAASVPGRIGPFDASAGGSDTVSNGPFGEVTVVSGRSQGYTVGGVGWYRKHFRVSKMSAERVELRFDGIMGRTTVWLNGVEIGSHVNPYTAFILDLTPHLTTSEENVLSVRVDSRGKTSRWYTGSGIYRHTWLTVTDPVHVPTYGVVVTTPTVTRSLAKVRVQVEVRNDGTVGRAAGVQVRVLDGQGRQVARGSASPAHLGPEQQREYVVELDVHDPDRWSLDNPHLYRAVAAVTLDEDVVDSAEQVFGAKTIELNSRGLFLNGERVKIVGGNIHHDHGPLGAVTLYRSDERRLELMKANGFNAVRSAHNPASPTMLEACDRLGMLLVDEFSDVWDIKKSADDYSNDFVEWYERDLTSFIRRGRNHPSVAMWSLGNEIEGDPNGYGPKMKTTVQDLDSTRAVIVGLAPGATFAYDYTDAIDTHYGNINRYYGVPGRNVLFDLHEQYPDKAILQSESYPVTLYEDYRITQDNDWMLGSFVWTAWDYIGESAIGAMGPTRSYEEGVASAFQAALGQVPCPWFSAACGDFDLIGQRRPQNYWRQVVMGMSDLEVFVERPTPTADTEQFAAWFNYYDELKSWTWTGNEGRTMKVRVYSSGDEVSLYLNDDLVDSKHLTEADQCVTTFDIEYRPGELTAVSKRNGATIARESLQTVGSPAALRLQCDVASLSTGRDELAHVVVEVVDHDGRVVPDALVEVRFEAHGGGEIVAVANGNPHNVDSFQRPRRWTWHGKALAIVRPEQMPGAVVITAHADGLKSDQLQLDVHR